MRTPKIRVRMPRSARTWAYGSTWKELLLTIIGTTISIILTFGTAACLAYRKAHNISADCVLLTPLEMTFENPAHNCLAFHGTADPWAATKNIERICKDKNVTLFEYPNANHSLITGIAARDETTLLDVIAKISDFI